MGAPNCPTPTKRGYKNPTTAKRHMWGLLTKKGGAHSWATLNVYKCQCGLCHVGHAARSAR